MKTAKDAEAVLETINAGSVANRGPGGLPRMQTLLDAVEKVAPMGEATTKETLDNEDVWQAI